jgi:hypothetical protein
VSFGVVSPAHEIGGERLVIAVELPSGHVAQLLDSNVLLFDERGLGGWGGHLVSADGYRYLNPSSVVKKDDAPGEPVTRELIGSTAKPGQSSERECSIYRFSVISDKQLPDRFQVQLPRIVVDGKEMMFPTLHFQYGRWTKWKGIGGV